MSDLTWANVRQLRENRRVAVAALLRDHRVEIHRVGLLVKDLERQIKAARKDHLELQLELPKIKASANKKSPYV